MADDYSEFMSTEEEAARFDIMPFDAAAGRAKLMARIQRANGQSTGQATMKGGSDFERGHHNEIRYRPTLNGKRIILFNEKGDHFATNSGKFGGLLTRFSADVDAGKYDDQIEAALAGQSSTGGKVGRVSTGGKGAPGVMRKSSLPARKDGIEHRVPASEEQPHKDYTLNKAKTFWRSPEQVADDDRRSAQRLASMKTK